MTVKTMKCSINFYKDKDGRWMAVTKNNTHHSLEGAKDLLDKALFLGELNAKDPDLRFRLLLSDKPFDHQLKLGLLEDAYHIVNNPLFAGQGSFFPSLCRFFGDKREILYMKVENRENKDVSPPPRGIDSYGDIPESTLRELRDWKNHVSPYE